MGIILCAFAFMFFVERNDDEDYATLLASFLSTFTAFVGEPSKSQNWLDVFFGIVTVVVLLNVVIAIISREWDDATRDASAVFWQYRLNFLFEVSRGLRAGTRQEREAVVSTKLGKLDPDEHYTESDINESLNILGREEEDMSEDIPLFFPLVKMMSRTDEKGLKRKWEDDEAPLWTYCVYRLVYSLLFLAGLVSFGLLWPITIRTRIFETKPPHRKSTEMKKRILDKVEKLNARIDRMEKKMDILLGHMSKLANSKASGL
jgi:hypothetical protein